MNSSDNNLALPEQISTNKKNLCATLLKIVLWPSHNSGVLEILGGFNSWVILKSNQTHVLKMWLFLVHFIPRNINCGYSNTHKYPYFSNPKKCVVSFIEEHILRKIVFNTQANASSLTVSYGHLLNFEIQTDPVHQQTNGSPYCIQRVERLWSWSRYEYEYCFTKILGVDNKYNNRLCSKSPC